MMYGIVNWSVRFRRIVLALTVGVLVVGFLQIGNAKRDILPEFSPTTVEVQTEALGLSAAEVEQLVTVPLEQDLLNGVAFLETIESASLPGLSSVVMTFESGTDLLDARQVVAERLTQAAGLPQVAAPPQMIQPLSSTSRVAMVSLDSDQLTPIEVSVLARWVMVPRLLGVEGVANVAIWGFRDQQLQVLVDPVELAQHNISLSQIISTTGNALEVSPLSFLEASSPGTGGFIDTVNQRLHVFHEQTISTPEQLAEVTIEGVEGGAVFVGGEALVLGDVSEVVTDHQPLIGDALCAGGPCILLVVEKFPDASTPAVAEGVDAALAALSPGLPGMVIDTSVYRPADFIAASQDNLRAVLIVAAVLLLVVLAVLFLNWRVALIAVASIASSLALAGAVLVLLDATVNLMILAGVVMALVVIIDDAVVGAWGSGTAGGDGAAFRQMSAAIVDSTLRLRTVAIYAAVIGAIALVPVFAMEGAGGAFLEPIALAYLLAVAAALVVSVTVAPALSVLLLTNGASVPKTSPFAGWLRRTTRGLVARLVPQTAGALMVFGVVVGAGLVSLALLTPTLRPQLEERDVLIRLEAAPGTSLARMDDITAQVVADLSTQPNVENIGAHVGRAIMSDQVVNVNAAEIWLKVGTSADYDATIVAIEGTVDGYESVASHVTTYSEQRVSEILGQTSDGLVVRVYGESAEIRSEMAEQIRGMMAGVDGVVAPVVAAAIEEPTIEIAVDVPTAQTYGVKPGDVRRQAATLMSGLVVGNLFEDQKVFDVVVWGVPGIRGTVDDVLVLPIATPSGDHVPLGELADVRIVPSPAVIRHESVATYVDVTAGVTGRSAGDVAADVDRALAGIAFPLEHHAEVLGGFEDAAAQRGRVIATAIASLVFIFLLFQAAFASWRLATLAFLLVPMGVSGSLIAVALTGRDLTLGAVAGTFAVLGLASRGVLLMVRSYEQRQRVRGVLDADAVVDETTRLAVPATASALALLVVFAPMAVAGPRAGLELGAPMAVAILGGLVTTVLLSLAVTPAVYWRWGRVAQPDTATDDLYAAEPTAMSEAGG